MEKRVRFRSPWLPWLLIAPQMAVIGVFFFWPAAQAVYQSVLQQDAFGTQTEFVGLLNFERLWDDSTYLASFQTTAANPPPLTPFQNSCAPLCLPLLLHPSSIPALL